MKDKYEKDSNSVYWDKDLHTINKVDRLMEEFHLRHIGNALDVSRLRILQVVNHVRLVPEEQNCGSE